MDAQRRCDLEIVYLHIIVKHLPNQTIRIPEVTLLGLISSGLVHQTTVIGRVKTASSVVCSYLKFP